MMQVEARNLVVLLTFFFAIEQFVCQARRSPDETSLNRKCYKCTGFSYISGNKTGCTDPFDASRFKTIICPKDSNRCIKEVLTETKGTKFERGCADVEDVQNVTDKGTGTFICSKDLCNASSPTTALAMFSLVALSSFVFSSD